MQPTIGLVVPCYNEEEVLGETTRRLLKLLAEMHTSGLVSACSSVYYVDDGSRDRTWSLIQEFSAKNKEICGIKLSQNCGHQNALLCGLLNAPGDALISVDADLQDDLGIIPRMIQALRAGDDIVYGVRRNRSTDTFFKRATAQGYYKLLNALGVKIVYNHADYRLMSRRALEALREYREVNVFLRGLIPLLGFKSSVIEYDRAERFAGESKYPLAKMLTLAWQGVTSFSSYPLRLITGIGSVISLMSLGFGTWALMIYMFTDRALPGWASTVIPMYFLGGVQLLGVGIIGEYIAKIYGETKGRPRFHIETILGRRYEGPNHESVSQ